MSMQSYPLTPMQPTQHTMQPQVRAPMQPDQPARGLKRPLYGSFARAVASDGAAEPIGSTYRTIGGNLKTSYPRTQRRSHRHMYAHLSTARIFRKAVCSPAPPHRPQARHDDVRCQCWGLEHPKRLHLRLHILESILGETMHTVTAQLLDHWQLDALIFLATDVAPTTRLATLRCRTRGELQTRLQQEAVRAHWARRLIAVDLLRFSNLAEVCSQMPGWDTAWADGPLYTHKHGTPSAGSVPPAMQLAVTAIQRLSPCSQSAPAAAMTGASDLHLAEGVQQCSTSECPENRANADHLTQDLLQMSASHQCTAAGHGEQVLRLRAELAESRMQVQLAELQVAASKTRHADAQRLAERMARARRMDIAQAHQRSLLQMISLDLK